MLLRIGWNEASISREVIPTEEANGILIIPDIGFAIQYHMRVKWHTPKFSGRPGIIFREDIFGIIEYKTFPVYRRKPPDYSFFPEIVTVDRRPTDQLIQFRTIRFTDNFRRYAIQDIKVTIITEPV